MPDRRVRQPTRVGRDAALSAERKTEFYADAAASRPERRNEDDNRKIVGVLVSYTWNPAGELFEVREGRNHIGAGDIKGENKPVDVQCPRDAMLSADHALILVQRGHCYIQDLSSVNGTALNGKPLRPESSEPLPSPAEIKAGETVFTFFRFDVAPASEQRKEEPEVPSHRKRTELK